MWLLMADDRHYVHGDWYRIDDRTGFKVRAKRTRKEWTGLIVDKDRWEYRHPQDFVKGVIDDQTVPEPRPRQVDVFIGPLETYLTATAPAGTTLVSVQSSARFLNNDMIEVMLDTGVFFSTCVLNVPSQTSITLENPLPWQASVDNVIVDLTTITGIQCPAPPSPSTDSQPLGMP